MLSKYLKSLVEIDFEVINTQIFPGELKHSPNSNGQEDVPYNVEFLFTSIPLKDTINYIVNRIYVER